MISEYLYKSLIYPATSWLQIRWRISADPVFNLCIIGENFLKLKWKKFQGNYVFLLLS
jgi:hypothetical protein